MNSMCRGCLSTNIDESNNNNKLLNLFSVCTQIHVDKNDGLPELICVTCAAKCSAWLDFRNMCQENEINLREMKTTMLSKTETEINSECTEIKILRDYNDSMENDGENDVDLVEIIESRDEEGYDDNEIDDGFKVQYMEDADMLYQEEEAMNDESFVNPTVTDVEEANTSVIYFSCIHCDMVFHNGDELEEHVKKQHTIRKTNEDANCHICKVRFSSKGNLKIHHDVAHANNKSTNKCQVCDEELNTSFDLENHMKNHKNLNSKIVCEECGRDDFASKHALQCHLLTHTTSAIFECLICGNQFKTQNILNVHMSRHEDEPKFTGSEGVKKYTSSGELTIHSRTHSCPYSCESCGTSYKTLSQLQTHRRTHSNRPFKCSDCDMSFTSANTLTDHQLVHIRESPHMCGICDKKFRKKTLLDMHLLTHLEDSQIVKVNKEWRAY